MHRRSDIKNFEYGALTDLLEREGLPEEVPVVDGPITFDCRCRDPRIVDAYLRDPRIDPLEKFLALADYAKVAQREPEKKAEFERNLPRRLRAIAIWADKTVYCDEVNDAISGFYCGMLRMRMENDIN